MSEIPNGWAETTLGSKCSKIGSGATPRGGNESYKTSGISLIRSQNVLDFTFSPNGLAYIDDEQAQKLDNVEVEPKDVLINITGDSVARVCMTPDSVLPARVNQHVAILRTNKGKLSADYLMYYLLNSNYKQYLLKLAGTGGTRNALTKGMLEGLELIIPPLEEQEAIADILTCLDDKIVLLQQQNVTLEKTAQTIFNEWFVNFNYPGATGEMIDSGFGPIPAGWSVGGLGNEFDITMGQSPKGETYNEVGDGMVFYQGRAEFGNRFPTQRLFTTSPQRTAEKFDILMSVRAPVGDINVASEKCCIGRGLCAISSDYKSYVFYKMKSLKKQLDVFESSGTVFGSINKSALENLTVIFPATKIVAKYENISKAIDGKIFNNFIMANSLAKTRDTLLPKLMSGEVRVEGFEG